MVSSFKWIPICKLCQRLEGDHILALTSVGANQFLHFHPQASKLQNLFLSRVILFSIKLPYALQSNLLFSKSPYFLQSYIIFPCVNPWLYWIGSNFSPQPSKLQLHILIFNRCFTQLADFPAVFVHISHWYLSWNWQIQVTRVSRVGQSTNNQFNGW